MKAAKYIPMPKINYNFKELDLYSEEGISQMCEEDEISLEEEAFMLGYLNA